MNLRGFEHFREWVQVTRRRKCSKKPLMSSIIEGARNLRSGCNHSAESSGEINWRPEPACAEFIAKQRSSEVTWLNIKQLIEPHATAVELTSTRQI